MKKNILVLLFSVLFSFTLLYGQVTAYGAPIVQDIHAQCGKGRKINVYWAMPENTESEVTKVLLYRTEKMVTSYDQLKNIEPAAELDGEATGYTDTLNDYSDYYYTVILVTDKPYEMVFVSMNTTAKGIHLAQVLPEPVPQIKKEDNKLYTNGTIRETPLPYLDYIDGINKEEQISEDVLKAAASLSSKTAGKKIYKANPYFFEEDLVSPDGGDDYILFEVLKNTFVQEKYPESITQLQKITGTNINEAVRNRAYFYIAEAQYFTGDYEESVKSFVKVAQVFPVQTKEWINLVLDTLSLPE